jgi:hypothetical protein
MIDTIDTPEAARWFVQTWLYDSDISPEYTASFITLMANRYQDNGPSLYARYLLSVAFREELLPTGWHEPLDSGWEFDGGRLVVTDEGAYIWPSEQQVNDWNIHNDHADGIETDEA